MGFWQEVCKRSALGAAIALGLDSRERIMIKVVVVTAILFALAFFGSEDASRDEIVARIAIGAVIVFLFPILFLWNLIKVPAIMHNESFSQINDAQATIVDLRQQVDAKQASLDDLTKPNFSLSIKQIIIGDVINPAGSHCLLYVEIVNKGTPAAAIESTWDLCIFTKENKIFKAHPQTLIGTKDYPFHASQTKRRYVRADGLDLRASSPIPRLGYASGVLCFVVRDLHHKIFEDNDTRLVLSVADGNGRRFSTTMTLAEIRSISNRTIFTPSMSHPMEIPINQP